MKHKKMFATAVLVAAGLGLLGTEVASAHGQTKFQQQATMLGISVDEVKAAWAQGKTIKQLAKERGISMDQLHAKMKDLHLSKLKARLDTLVSKGVITQAQADKRYQTLQANVANAKGHMKGFGMRHMW